MLLAAAAIQTRARAREQKKVDICNYLHVVKRLMLEIPVFCIYMVQTTTVFFKKNSTVPSIIP